MEELRREREQAEAEKVMPSEQVLVRVSSGQVAIAVSRSRLEEVGFGLSVSGCPFQWTVCQLAVYSLGHGGLHVGFAGYR